MGGTCKAGRAEVGGGMGKVGGTCRAGRAREIEEAGRARWVEEKVAGRAKCVEREAELTG